MSLCSSCIPGVTAHAGRVNTTRVKEILVGQVLLDRELRIDYLLRQ